jgi:hypothetical protein
MDPFKREEVISAFLLRPNICKEKLGNKIKDCESIRSNFDKDMNVPGGCPSCRKKAVFNKYRSIVYKNIIDD